MGAGPGAQTRRVCACAARGPGVLAERWELVGGVRGGDCGAAAVFPVRSGGGSRPLEELEWRRKCFLPSSQSSLLPARSVSSGPLFTQPWEEGSCPGSH